jgi:hypothetical protein
VALPAAVALVLAASSYSVFGAVRDHSERTLALTSTTNPSWIDERIGTGTDAAYIYGATPDYFSEAQVLWQTEFWNRSVDSVYTLGPADPALTATPATLDTLSGEIVPQAGSSDTGRYVVAPQSMKIDGRLIAQHHWLALYRTDGEIRLATGLGGVYADSWMGDFAAFTHFAKPRRAGHLEVRISRLGWGGPTPPGKVTIKIGRFGEVNGGPGITQETAARTWTVRSGAARSFVVPTPKAPYRLEIRVTPTFSPIEYGQPDTRQLGAQVQISPAASWTG